MPDLNDLNICIQWNVGTACVSECMLKTLACRGFRVSPSLRRGRPGWRGGGVLAHRGVEQRGACGHTHIWGYSIKLWFIGYVWRVHKKILEIGCTPIGADFWEWMGQQLFSFQSPAVQGSRSAAIRIATGS